MWIGGSVPSRKMFEHRDNFQPATSNDDVLRKNSHPSTFTSLEQLVDVVKAKAETDSKQQNLQRWVLVP
jgi:hypothetical protein